jgi:hypothetical protein
MVNGYYQRVITISFELYCARRFIESRTIESAAYCDQNFQILLNLNSKQKMLVNWIIRLLLSLLCRPKVIILSGGYYQRSNQFFRYEFGRYKVNLLISGSQLEWPCKGQGGRQIMKLQNYYKRKKASGESKCCSTN